MHKMATFISSTFWLHFWKWPLVVHLSVSGLSLQWVLFASVIVLLSYLLSSHVSTRLCAAKARRRDSGSHGKKVKTQWGGEKMKYSLKWMWWNSSMTKQKKGRCETETNLRPLKGEWSCVRILDCCPLTVLPLSARHSWFLCCWWGTDSDSFLCRFPLLHMQCFVLLYMHMWVFPDTWWRTELPTAQFDSSAPIRFN